MNCNRRHIPKLCFRRRHTGDEEHLQKHLRHCAETARKMQRRGDWPWRACNNRRGP